MKRISILSMCIFLSYSLSSQSIYGEFVYESSSYRSFASSLRKSQNESDTISINEKIRIVNQSNFTESILNHIDTVSIMSSRDTILVKYKLWNEHIILYDLVHNTREVIALNEDEAKIETLVLVEDNAKFEINEKKSRYNDLRLYSCDHKIPNSSHRLLGSLTDEIFCPIGLLVGGLTGSSLAPIRIDKVNASNPGDREVIRLLDLILIAEDEMRERIRIEISKFK